MTKYRIVKRNTYPSGGISRYPYYYAQRNIFGIWVDLRFHPFADTYNASDMEFDAVERWLNDYIEGNRPQIEEVVKVYE